MRRVDLSSVENFKGECKIAKHQQTIPPTTALAFITSCVVSGRNQQLLAEIAALEEKVSALVSEVNHMQVRLRRDCSL